MGALTLTTMQARVAMNCGNLSTDDPIYTNSNSLKDYINEAASRIILLAVVDPTNKNRRTNFDAFPELRDRTWVDITVNNQNYLLLPDTCLVPDSIMNTQSDDTYDQSRSNEYIVTETDIDTFVLLDKTTSTTGYPQMWVREADRFRFWPVPTTSYLTRIVLRGIRKEDDLTSGTDTFTMNPIWHPAVVAEATALTCAALGWWEDEEKWHAQANAKIGEATSLLGSSNRKNRFRLKFAGAPGQG